MSCSCNRAAARLSAAGTARQTCNQQVDYSAVTTSSRILPFRITLDTAQSVLTPTAGARQRFSYLIEGIGQETADYADLSHMLLGICDTITQEEISDLSVVIDGVSQTVTWGDNVELRTAERPDPTTGCTGLKLDFPVDKTVGVMRVAFSLARTYPVGPVATCLYGGGAAVGNLAVCGPVCAAVDPDTDCPVTGYQTVDVCVPVTVTPYATVGTPAVTCCGAATVASGAAVCAGTAGGSCSFTISQRLCVAVPVAFGAQAQVGEHTVSCVETSGENLCAACDAPSAAARR